MGRLALLICVALLSAAMANGTRPAGTVGGTAASSPPVVVATTQTAGDVTPPPPVATAGTTAHSDQQQQQPPLDDPTKDNKRKVPNGPDPIHNRY